MMKVFLLVLVLIVLGVAGYVYFVDPELIDKFPAAAKQKSNEFGMSDDCVIGTFERLDRHLVDRLDLRKEQKPGEAGLTEYHYINEHGEAELKEFIRSVVLHVDSEGNVKRITGQTLYSLKKGVFVGAVSNFMNEYWHKLTGDEKPEWEGMMMSTQGGGGNAYARYKDEYVDAEYHWQTGGHPYRKLKIIALKTGGPGPALPRRDGTVETSPNRKAPSRELKPTNLPGKSRDLESKDVKSHLFIEVNYPDADISLDDGELDYSRGMELAPGAHKITIRREGCCDEELSFIARPGVDKHLVVNLKSRK
ncbi:MAG: hypothetical protein JW808_06200 [Victivallales bacterium]|nr:hypothetical protein [Victivallales bacterium]